MTLKVLLLFFSLPFLFCQADAQDVHFVDIGINGLHCSACTYSVEKSLQKLDFVSVIQMNLNERSGLIYFKEGEVIDYQQLAKAVVDAGFSVRSFEVVFREKFEGDQSCVGSAFCIVGNEMNRGNRLKILGKRFQEKRDFKNSASYLAVPCENCGEAASRFKAIIL